MLSNDIEELYVPKITTDIAHCVYRRGYSANSIKSVYIFLQGLCP